MSISLTGKDFLKILDFSQEDLCYLLKLAHSLKSDKKNNKEIPRLTGKNIVLLFQKDSTRTRCAFETAAFDQGANITYIGPSGSHLGTKESIADTARVLSSMYDGIQLRGHAHADIETLAKYSSVPVYNGLTDDWHPTQMLADFMTIEEVRGSLNGTKMAYFGDARNNVAHSYLIMSAKMGIELRIAAPKSLQPNQSVIKLANEINTKTGGKLIITENSTEAATKANVLVTDVWVSMGEDKSVWESRINLLKPYQINSELVAHAESDYTFLHCLPAFHDLGTDVAKQIFKDFGFGDNGLEVTNDVFESKHSHVFREAENRAHTIKAVMVATLA